MGLEFIVEIASFGGNMHAMGARGDNPELSRLYVRILLYLVKLICPFIILRGGGGGVYSHVTHGDIFGFYNCFLTAWVPRFLM